MCLQLSFRCQVILLCFLLLGSFHCSSIVDGFKVEMYHMVQYCNIKSYISKPNMFTKVATLLHYFLDIILKNAEQDESSVLLFYYNDQT